MMMMMNLLACASLIPSEFIGGLVAGMIIGLTVGGAIAGRTVQK